MKIDFSFETPYGPFMDTLIFVGGEPIPSDAEIEALKQQRLDNWIASITQPTQE
jgi:hypothetical protein